VKEGVDPMELPLDRLLNFVYFWATEEATEEDRRKFDAQVFRPLPGKAATVGPWAPENENKALHSLGASLGLKTGGAT